MTTKVNTKCLVILLMKCLKGYRVYKSYAAKNNVAGPLFLKRLELSLHMILLLTLNTTGKVN